MRRPILASGIAAVILAGAALAVPAVAVAAPVVLAPRIQRGAGERARLQAVADQGPEALRRYLWRTRMIYGWTWRDLVAGE